MGERKIVNYHESNLSEPVSNWLKELGYSVYTEIHHPLGGPSFVSRISRSLSSLNFVSLILSPPLFYCDILRCACVTLLDLLFAIGNRALEVAFLYLEVKTIIQCACYCFELRHSGASLLAFSTFHSPPAFSLLRPL